MDGVVCCGSPCRPSSRLYGISRYRSWSLASRGRLRLRGPLAAVQTRAPPPLPWMRKIGSKDTLLEPAGETVSLLAGVLGSPLAEVAADVLGPVRHTGHREVSARRLIWLASSPKRGRGCPPDQLAAAFALLAGEGRAGQGEDALVVRRVGRVVRRRRPGCARAGRRCSS